MPRHRLAGALLACAAAALHVEALHAEALPPEAELALQRARVPDDALAVVIQELGSPQPVLTLQADKPVNPASLTKLLTTYAALERLGPAWTWSTPVWLQGRMADGVLDGSVYIKGSGDPTLVVERVWLLLKRIQQTGIQEIRGDIVLDNSAFAAPEGNPAEFDGEPLRPYNVKPAALLLNYRALTYTFVPDPAAGVARVLAEPALDGLQVDRTVPLAAGPCEDWRAALKAEFTPERSHFAGHYAASCGELSWPVADVQPATYNARLVQALWKELGGRLGGSVREGSAPPDVKPSFEARSRPLAEVVREINKFSNNVMAQQLFYTLDLVRHPGQPATTAGARDALRRWLGDKLGDAPAELVLDNGSGLSRETRMPARVLARLLTHAYDGPLMPDLMASLPIVGTDGTLRRSRATAGRGYLKTGSLRDVAGLAGYVLSDSGRRYVFVAIVQHPNANAARPALDALLAWTMRDAPARRSPVAGDRAADQKR